MGKSPRLAAIRILIDAVTPQDASADLYLTSVTEPELRAGAAILPSGRRRDRLVTEVDVVVREYFAGRALPFDSAAARAYAAIAASRRSEGRPIPDADCQIAAIARAGDASVATRSGADFENRGIAVINCRSAPRNSIALDRAPAEIRRTIRKMLCMLRSCDPYGWDTHDRRHKGDCYRPPGRCEELDGPGLQIPRRRHC